MFGLFHSEKTLILKAAEKIIHENFVDGFGRPYVVSPMTKFIFKGAGGQIINQGGNDFDVAIGFMLIQVNSLVNPEGEIKAWAESTMDKCEVLMKKGRLGQKIINNS